MNNKIAIFISSAIVINRLMLSIGYCYQSAIVIIFGMNKRDHIKRLPLYNKKKKQNKLKLQDNKGQSF